MIRTESELRHSSAPHSVASTPVDQGVPDEADVRSSYDLLHATETFESPPEFLRFVGEVLDPQSGQRLLDIGCGSGQMLRALRDEGDRGRSGGAVRVGTGGGHGAGSDAEGGLHLSGIDLSPVAVQAASTALPDADVRQGTAQALPWKDGHFDRVVSLGTLEHLPDPRAGAREIRRVLNEDGVGFVFVPNTYYWLVILKTALTGEGHDEGQPIQRHGSRLEWEQLLVDEGLTVESVHTWRYPIRLLPFRPKILLGSLIERAVPQNLLLGFGYRVRVSS